MSRILEKGISPPPDTLDPSLNKWLNVFRLQFPKISTYEESINLASVNASSYSTQTFTVTGLTTEDVITVNPPALTSGLYLVSWRVSADNTLSLTFYNSTGGAIDEAAASYKIMACKL